MAVWIQSLSWTLIYSLGQGFLVFGALWILLKMMRGISSAAKYGLSLIALSILLLWFGITWWQQFNAFDVANGQIYQSGTVVLQQWQLDSLHPDALLLDPIFSSFKRFLPWLSVFYIIGLVFMLMRLSLGIMQLFSLRKSGISKVNASLEELLIVLKSRLRLQGKVRLYTSVKAQVPMIIGFFKPIILIPAASVSQLSIEQLEAILLHELAHIKRHDYLINILQTIVETILFFNPFVWLISAIIRREREHCCDDLVLVHTREPLYYATALAALAAYPASASGLLVAATGQSHHLFHRIKRIVEMKKNPFSYSRMVAAILIIAAVSGSVVWLTPSFANSKNNQSNRKSIAGTTTSTTTSTTTKTTQQSITADNQEEIKLVKLLSNDHLIDERKGFIIERKGEQLFIDYKLQKPEVSAKYLTSIAKKELRVEVYPFKERIKRHPGTGLLQLAAPVILSSPCVDYKPKKKDDC